MNEYQKNKNRFRKMIKLYIYNEFNAILRIV